MSQYTQQYVLRRPGVGDVIAIRGGHPVTVSLSKGNGAYTASLVFSEVGNPQVRQDSDWISLTTLNTSDETDVAVPLTAKVIATRVTTIAAGAPRLSAIMTVTSSALAGLHQRRRHASGRQDDFGVAPPPIIPPIPFFPNQADLEHHYDYTDINVLWQDTLLTNPITANGQSILGVTDKGAGGVDLDKGLTPRIFDNVSFPFSVAGGDGGAAGVNSGFVSGTFPPPQTFFVVYQVNVDSLGDLISLEGTSGFKISTKGDIAFNSWYNSLQLTSGAPDEHDKWLAAVIMHRANNTQSLWHSQDATERTGATTAITLQLAGDIDVCAFNTNGSNPNRGPVAEAGAWNVDDVGVPTLVDDFKTYTSNEYGVVWE